MEKRILLERTRGETCAAVLTDGKLSEVYVERPDNQKLTGNLYVGRVMNVLPGMQCAFVDIGLHRNAFLYADDCIGEGDKIQKLVKGGQEILVQVTKEPEGDKGPRISMHVSLAGRLMVVMPTLDYVAVSRRISPETERERLRGMLKDIVPPGVGVIVRTAAVGAKPSDFAEEIAGQLRVYEGIAAQAAHTRAPALLFRDEELWYRVVRDMLTYDVSQVLVSDQAQYEQARELAGLISPELAERVQHYSEAMPLLARYGVSGHIESCFARRAWLKSGGYLIFDHTEALTVIDVNTGKFTGKKELRDTILKTNREAAGEIARQLLLRDIAGIILIDFIDMETQEERDSVLGVLKEALALDRVRTNVVGFTGLGLVEMTRKRTARNLSSQIFQPCGLCQGVGVTPTADTVARSVLYRLDVLASEGAKGTYLARVNPAVAQAMDTLEGITGIRLILEPDEKRKPDQYDIAPAPAQLPKGARPHGGQR